MNFFTLLKFDIIKKVIKLKTKEYKSSLEKEPKIQDKKNKRKGNKKWIFQITLVSFIISLGLSLISELIMPNALIAVAVFLVLIFISIGIVFDAIGLAVATADEKIFHSMATKNVKGAKKAIKLITNKEKVSSFLNDVIGDICGVISGSCGLAISLKLNSLFDTNLLLTTIIITSIISALTIGGKAFGKTIGINNCNEIVFEFSKLLNAFSKNK